MLNNPQGAMNLNQMLPQNVKSMVNQAETANEENRIKMEHTNSCEAFLKEFQAKSMSLLFSQNKMLGELKEKNDILQETLALLIGEINNIKNSLTSRTQAKSPAPNNPILLHQNLSNSTETVNVETLIAYLYGSNPEFQYQLVLKNDLPLPLYRERNFKFTVYLVDTNGNIVENSNRIPLTIGIYSSENPPKYIDSNTAGNFHIANTLTKMHRK